MPPSSLSSVFPAGHNLYPVGAPTRGADFGFTAYESQECLGGAGAEACITAYGGGALWSLEDWHTEEVQLIGPPTFRNQLNQ